MPTPEYRDERFCGHCQADTDHICRDDTHERDSSQDYQCCTVCGWWRMGHGKPHAPLPPFKVPDADA